MIRVRGRHSDVISLGSEQEPAKARDIFIQLVLAVGRAAEAQGAFGGSGKEPETVVQDQQPMADRLTCATVVFAPVLQRGP